MVKMRGNIEVIKLKKFLFTFVQYLCNLILIQEIISQAIESGNEHQFWHVFCHLNINPNKKLSGFGSLSTFEKVLKTPNSRKFIEICLTNGSDFYRVSKSCLNLIMVYNLENLHRETLSASSHFIMQLNHCASRILKR